MKLIAKTFKGLEDVLAGELTALGAKDVKILKRAVSFESNKELLYKSNLWSRTALRILQPLTTFKAKNEYELYEAVKAYNWSPYLNVDQTLAVDAVVYSRFFKHSKYVALKVKDAICDQFRDATGKRPSVDLVRPTLLLNVHVAEDQISISMDSSGEPLNRRGYRTKEHPAPINESLAAGMLLLAGWDGSVPFLDPMCGSGTIVMEATMIAAKMAPNIRRKEFGFMRWNNYDANLWQRIVDEAKAAEIKPQVPIFGSDIAVKAIDISRQSALDFGLKQYINYSVSAFRETVPPAKKGLIVMNPPYDERLKERDVVRLYSEIGTQLKHVFMGWDAWIISSNFEALKFLALKPGSRYTLYNGALECRYQQFKMYEGSLKK
ncbi:THUMP domain-containing class I SAM-dependent RNA methyltransferase [Geofilum sp. OHC36d9]|uniref:THUMP domain-containing class I SAM-dependent RNA methyltransferase n=1 Tax=Geofilum sp. OHC36d9 TaxID=3458413 RepID=UPI004034D2CE